MMVVMTVVRMVVMAVMIASNGDNACGGESADGDAVIINKKKIDYMKKRYPTGGIFLAKSYKKKLI